MEEKISDGEVVEFIKYSEDIIKKSFEIILNKRIFINKISKSTDKSSDKRSEKINSKVSQIIKFLFLTIEQINFDLDEVFSDEYECLKSNKKNKEFILDIFYNKNSARLLIERWNFTLNSE